MNHLFKMKEEETLKIEHLNAQNSIYIAIDYLNNLSLDIDKANPTDKWKDIAKTLNTINNDLSNFKLFYCRIYQEFEKVAAINYKVSKKGIKDVIDAFENLDKYKREIEFLKKNIK